MNAVNFDKEMEKTVSGFKDKKTLLLHACCAPCSTACIERLKDFFNITVYFYNPNMDTAEEYEKRKIELLNYCEKIGVRAVAEDFNPAEFYRTVRGLEKEPEGGERCEKCFYLRLKKTALTSIADCYDYFTTTLTVSPLKNATIINAVGQKVAEETGANYLPSDFKKRNGYKRSVEISCEYGLYRQNYCGCVFSKRQPRRTDL